MEQENKYVSTSVSLLSQCKAQTPQATAAQWGKIAQWDMQNGNIEKYNMCIINYNTCINK